MRAFSGAFDRTETGIVLVGGFENAFREGENDMPNFRKFSEERAVSDVGQACS